MLFCIGWFLCVIVAWSQLYIWGHPPFVHFALFTCALYLLFAATMMVAANKLQGLQRWSETLSGKSLPYQSLISTVMIIACHVWVQTVTTQIVIDKSIILGAPKNINWTYPNRTYTKYMFLNVANYPNQNILPIWFEDDYDSLHWIFAYETFTSVCILTHLTLLLYFQRKPNLLYVIDLIIGVSVVLMKIIPDGYYTIYQIGGIVRFLGLFHLIVALETYIQTRQHKFKNMIISWLIILKLMFVTLMGAAIIFVAEKPCTALGFNDCTFDDFGNTVYFIFVTLSTVGYGDMSPQTSVGKLSIVIIIIFAISYLPNAIAEAINMCRTEQDYHELHGRFDKVHQYLEKLQTHITEKKRHQIGWFMHGGTHSKLHKALERNKKSAK